MRKLLIAGVAVLAMTGAAYADNYQYRPRHHHHNNNNGALLGGLIGGIIIGGMLTNPRPSYSYEPRPYYYERCYRSFEGQYWNGYRWVSRYRDICE